MLNAPVALQPDRAYMVSAMIKGNVSYWCVEQETPFMSARVP